MLASRRPRQSADARRRAGFDDRLMAGAIVQSAIGQQSRRPPTHARFVGRHMLCRHNARMREARGRRA